MLAESGLFKCHACSGHLVLTLAGVLYFRTGAGPGSDRKLGRVHIPSSLPQACPPPPSLPGTGLTRRRAAVLFFHV